MRVLIADVERHLGRAEAERLAAAADAPMFETGRRYAPPEAPPDAPARFVDGHTDSTPGRA